jgi:hypothetical protein
MPPRIHVAAPLLALVVTTPLAGVVSPAFADIDNIAVFLEQCPTTDPAYAQIRSDFIIRQNGIIVGDIACREPYTTTPAAELSDALVLVQGLRVLYYMDRGRAGHLPWTSGTVYDWMKSRVRGFNISDTAVFNSCCRTIDGGLYIVLTQEDAFQRLFDRTWRGISGNIALYAHEARHVDGYSHDSGCGITAGCDATFDPTNLSAYGVQWWLNVTWLDGSIYVGFSCLDPAARAEITEWHRSAIEGYRRRFSSNPPPVVGVPAEPGGACRTTALPAAPSNVMVRVAIPTLTVTWTAPANAAPIGYRLDFSSAGVVVASMVVGPSSAATLTIPRGTVGTFTLVMTALGAAGAGVSSPPVSFAINDASNCAGPPATPGGLAGSFTGGTAVVSWAPSIDADSYHVQAGSAPTTSDLFDANVGRVTSVAASGLPPWFRAFVRVRAVNACGTSAPGFVLLALDSCAAPPPAPTGLRGTVTAGTAVVEWDPVDGATRYGVFAGSSPGASDLYSGDVRGVTRVSAAGLPPGFRAWVGVLALNDCGASATAPVLLLR